MATTFKLSEYLKVGDLLKTARGVYAIRQLKPCEGGRVAILHDGSKLMLRKGKKHIVIV